jgi:signal peptidase I
MTSENNTYKVVKSFLEVLFFVLLFVALFKIFLFDFFLVKSDSMYPVLEKNDIIVINKSKYRLGFTGFSLKMNNIRSNDIVVFNENSKKYVKRIIGKPGDRLFIKRINNRIRYSLHDDLYTIDSTYIPGKDSVIKLNSENIELFLFDIYREGNSVSYINRRIIINDEFKNDYKFKKNYYFVVGDNYDNSIDSRDFGIISESQIKGKPFFILKSDNSDKSFRWIY